jgi:hypothetical protein
MPEWSRLLKKKASRTVLILFLVSITLLTLGIPLVRAEHLVGVKVGDWIKYDYTALSAPSGTEIPMWVKAEILAVEGMNITLRLTMHLSNETEDSEVLTVDFVYYFYLPPRTLDTLFGWCFIIAANSTAEADYIYFNLMQPPLQVGKNLTGETVRTYAGASRTVVYADFLGHLGGRYGSQPLKYCWDKQTGILVEASATINGVLVTAKATETNMWEAPAVDTEAAPFWMQWWFWVIIAVIFVTVAGAVYFLKRRKPPTPTAPSLPTEGT